MTDTDTDLHPADRELLEANPPRPIPLTLRDWRVNKRGWTQAILAEKSGISAPTISFAENGETTTSDLVKNKLAKALGVEVDDILWLERRIDPRR
jgi:DNA-binding XRE family transcriptional regulator